ncbi:Amino acid adenylation domain-containing protein [Rhodovastum atsumiense]|uniref:Amino acid adenylation domain-containing protein n=1 Tax=Rhodovastum atsumiense TaxID=504468 RepID=A0A5M6IRY5_9PROT|nr:non-ribosomal peptide synthetase/type I polyketide synthase [Rhodovastum atsumiense]KAA5610951.1 amino acid adenylation domain-containing protein [Rhodovastum atsumiense]CAH2601472.1 Amino acid adenylation domain-containing protein [Rhodovastum atsumiense]
MTSQSNMSNAHSPGGIAIIGMAARLPGADDVAGFWRNLCEGVDSIAHFSEAELEDAFPAEIRRSANFVRARPILPDADKFDAGFFGMQAREAELTDPQHRVFLEICWEALEDAGCDPARFAGAIGVFAGASMPTYFLHNVLADRGVTERFTSAYQVTEYPLLLGALPDVLATRVAYKLNLRGPAMTVQSACSTSLLAVAQACKSLLMFESDMALAGGVSITFPQKRGYLHQEGGMVSADGRCRPFDAEASGTVFGSGAAVVLLRRVEDAIAAGDHIHAVIRGHAVNNDGNDKVGFTAPSVEGQVSVIAAAQAVAGVEPEEIGFIECHGTATPLGDPIEVAALRQAFATGARGVCALGSTKSNVGHLDTAAGATGLIKAALAVRHGVIPPTVHFHTPNPRMDLGNSPFFVNDQVIPWPNPPRRRVAGVSALGVGGTNVHVVLEEPPLLPRPADTRPAQVLVLSARSEAALASMRSRLAAHLQAYPELSLADVAFTLQTGRREFPHRCAVVAADTAQAAVKLAAPSVATTLARATPPLAFMFPGQGAQYPGMGRDLYAHEPCFRHEVDACAAILQPILGQDIRDLLYGEAKGEDNPLLATVLAQPAIFVTEYALARTLMAQGLRPDAMIGHSIGEFVAATLAGVMRLEDALAVIAARGRLMQDLPRGGMLAVRLPEEQVLELLGTELDLAAINGPSVCVVAGPLDAIATLEAELQQRGILARRLHTSHAFHSRMMDPAVAGLAGMLHGISLRTPQLRYVSTVTGQWITPEEATSPEYWARHCRAPVRFAAALATLAECEAPALVEVGPGKALTTLALQALPAGPQRVVVASLPDATREATDHACLNEALGRLWMAGLAPDWAAHHAPAPPQRVPLPTYPFERRRHWIEPPRPGATANAVSVPMTNAAESHDKPMEIAMTTAALSPADARPAKARAELVAIFEKLSGEDLSTAPDEASFLELGFDSLMLGQAAQQIQARFAIRITFRQLLGEFPNLAALSAHVAQSLPPETAPAATPVAVHAATGGEMPAPAIPSVSPAAGTLEAVVQAQLDAMRRLMTDQLALLRGLPASATAHPAPQAVPAPSPPAGGEELPSRFSLYRPGAQIGAQHDLTAAQLAHIADLTARYTAKTVGSKRLTQEYRDVLADPRAAAGFRAEWKEMVYPIASGRSKGAKIWDVDGNEYVDLVNGYGQTCFGHAPDFVVDAVTRQLQDGFAIGPQSDISGEVARLFCEMTGNERATFCNTGSEAVMAAIRVARCVTGRDKVAVFGGAYHGQFDEVLVKGARRGAPPRALPVAPGIPAGSVQNMVVLAYDDPESLAWVRAHAGELAAVICETVQSRHPALQPRDFLQELRRITEDSGTALVFDEVVTGFRMHPGGMQALFGIRADLATYGKVVGGGMPVGVLAGRRRFMDALDGGMWQYGDDSIPEVAPTFFAGTFVRHPLVLAALKAVLLHLKEAGPELQERLTARTAALVASLNDALAGRGLRTRIENFGSMFYFAFGQEDRLGSLLYYHLRLRGIHIAEGFPCFLTTAHTEADLARIVDAFRDSLDEMLAAGAITAKEAPRLKSLDEAPLTEPQTEIWLAAQLGDDASCSFNESISLRLDGTLDEAALEAALADVVSRHDALRARFRPDGERMLITATPAPAWRRHDLSALPPAEAGRKLDELVMQDAATAFDLVAGPPVRAQLVRLADDAHVLVFTAHHIVCDGWSMNVIAGELAACYAARSAGKAPALPSPLPYSVHAARQAVATTANETAERYWMAQFATPVPELELPSDRPRPNRKSFRGATYRTHIDADLYQAVKRAGAKRGCTLFVTLLGAFQLLMGRLAGQRDVVVAIPSAGQSLVEDQILVGHCVNLLPLRATWQADTSAAAFMATLKQTVMAAYEHQGYTFGTLVRRLDLRRELNRLPLTQLQFNLEKLGEAADFPGLAVRIAPNPKRFVNFDIFLNVIESDAGLRIDCDYSTDLFDEATIARWIGHWRALLAAIAEDADRTVASLPMMDAATLQQLTEGWNRTAVAHDLDRGVHDLIAAQAAETPDRIAAGFGGTSLTYAALDRRANQLAHHLRGILPAGEQRVGILVERSLDMLVALLGVLKAGYAYVPLDPGHPEARLRLILEQAQVAGVITDDAAAEPLLPTGAPLIRLDHAWAEIAARPGHAPGVEVRGDDLAYVIFTSGSTGTPKGVEVRHRSVVNLLLSMIARPGLRPDDVMMAVTTIAFDIAGLELFAPLVVGARVEIAAHADVVDGFALCERMRGCNATVMQATPSLWQMLLDAGFRPIAGMKLLCGGEKLSRSLADRLLEDGAELWNMYGPTETTIWSSTVRILPDDGPVTIGLPIANTSFHVVDDTGALAPVGVPGELWIGGEGLARGYLDRPALTAERFVTASPGTAPPTRFYRTGDVARRLADGRVQLLGRNDQQVKLRGFRIELGEIEEVLARVDGVQACAVALQEEWSRLVGYWVERPGTGLTPERLRASLARHLPDYMVPALWLRLETMPLNPNGKIDRWALRAPDAGPLPAAAEHVEPETELQRQLATIWQEVLGLSRIGLTDNLLDLGADSIHLFQIAARSMRAGLAVTASQLLRHPTIEALAQVVAPADAAAAPIVTPLRGPSLGQFRRGPLQTATIEPLGTAD